MKYDQTVVWEMAMTSEADFNVVASVNLDNIIRIFDLRHNSNGIIQFSKDGIII